MQFLSSDLFLLKHLTFPFVFFILIMECFFCMISLDINNNVGNIKISTYFTETVDGMFMFLLSFTYENSILSFKLNLQIPFITLV